MLRIGVLILVFLPAGGVDAQVYTHRDVDGVFHFTKVPVADSEPFEVRRGPRRAAPKPARTGRRLPERIGQHSFDPLIHEVADRYGVEPELVKALIRVESRFDPAAVSPRGARGLMQIMPLTARWYGVSDPHDPRQNVRAGVRYLRSLLDRFGKDPRLALAAYNAGPTVVARYGGLPPYRETRAYVEKVLRLRRDYRANPYRGEPIATTDSGTEAGQRLMAEEETRGELLSFLSSRPTGP